MTSCSRSEVSKVSN